ncbi:MAG: putative peptidoglycan lipid II flippase [Phycisphaerales bacterium]|jgi:putative peptidoglycan lipid II flippase
MSEPSTQPDPPPSTPPAGDAQPESIGSHVRTVSGITLISRFAGLGRDLITARIFGDTVVGSAFAAAFTIPNTFRRLLGEGALSAAFLPQYTRLADSDESAGINEAGPYAAIVLRWLALVTGAITVVLELVLLAIILLAPGPFERSLSLKLMMVALPFMPLVCTSAILGGMLQAHHRFGVWAAAPIIMNAAIIAAAVPFYFIEGMTAAAWAYPIVTSTLVAGSIQIAWSLTVLRRHVRWGVITPEARAHAREMLRRMVPALIGLGTLQLNSLIDTVIAMYPIWVGPTIAGRAYPLDESSNSILFFAQRLYQFPLGVFGIAVATAAFPALSRAAGDPARFGSLLRRGVRLSLFIGLPASVGLLLVRDDLVTVLYSGSGGGFSDEGVARASMVLLMYAGAVWAYSLNQLFTRAFYAHDDTRTPMRVAMATVGLNLVLNLILIWHFREAGLALATASTAVLQTVLLGWLLRRKLSATEKPADSAGAHTARGVIGVVLLSLTMGVAVALVMQALPNGTWAQAAIRLAAATAVGGVAYLVLARLTRRPELTWLLHRSTAADKPEATDGD